MRLLEYNNDGELSLTEFHGCDIPKYAILSHTWGAEEFTFKDLIDGTGKNKTGYDKIRFCAQRVADDRLQYFWVDTCCIDKSSSAELQEAINSMYRWYCGAVKCYVYLSDVSWPPFDAAVKSTKAWELTFRKSRWFTRGWTLQELIAPESVEFYSKEGKLLGDKASLEQHIHEITGIPVRAFRGSHLSDFGINERMSWAKGRRTVREEDGAYSLLGIFNVYMPLIYGERRDNAFRRLHEEIEKPLKRLIIPRAAEPHLDTPPHISTPVCERDKSDRSSGYQGPLEPHLNSPVHGFNCNKCSRTFGSRSALEQHVNSAAHGFNCNKCSRTFGSRSALEQHVNSAVHGFNCNKCSRTFGSQSALEQHVNSAVHGFNCNKCSRTFGSQSALEQHLKSPAHGF